MVFASNGRARAACSVYPPFTHRRRDRRGRVLGEDTAERRDALLAALAGRELAGTGGIALGRYDLRTVEWLAGSDIATAATVVCWLRRVRAASIYDALHARPGEQDWR